MVPPFFQFMKKLVCIFVLSLFSIFYKPNPTWAKINVVSSSANILKETLIEDIDTRVLTLHKFLKKQNSPLLSFANELVFYADQYNIDWRLVTAICGVESTFGKRIPKNSYNAYGWNNGNYKFNSWSDSIEKISKSLREKYYIKGVNDINKISKVYAPPSSSWAWKVRYFMYQIDPIPIEFDF